MERVPVARKKEHEIRPQRRTVITGMGALSPLGTSFHETWTNVNKGLSKVEVVQDESYKGRIAMPIRFDPDDFLSLQERKIKQRASRAAKFAYLATREALEDAGLTIDNALKEEIDKERFGVYVGTGIGGIEHYYEAKKIIAEKGPGRVPGDIIFKILPERSTSIVNLAWGLKGWSGSIVTACATGGQNIAESMHKIRLNINDLMVCGGTDGTVTDVLMAGFGNINALADKFIEDPQKASRPFDEDSSGFVPSEGAAIMILEDEEHALKRAARIYAELAGVWCNDDGFHEAQPDPVMQAKAISNALRDAGVRPEEVDLYVAHATSTGLSELKEVEALRMVFGEHVSNIAITAPKSTLGHQLGAAGAMTALFAARSVYEGIIPPTINLENPREEFHGLNFVKESQKRKVKVSVGFSAGFGGFNAALIFKEYIP